MRKRPKLRVTCSLQALEASKNKQKCKLKTNTTTRPFNYMYLGVSARFSWIPRVWFKELNPRRRVYVEIPKPVRVELKCSQNPRC
jgi:hypothetical protein